LAARGIILAEGGSSDGPDAVTVYGLGARKNQRFLDRIRIEGVDIYPSTIALIRRLRAFGVKIAVVSASRNCRKILQAARLDGLFDAVVDGLDIQKHSLRGKPAPDTFLEAARQLGAAPARTFVVEDTTAGIMAARAGELGLVVGVDRPDERCRELCATLHLGQQELAHWDEVSRKLYLPFHEDGILSQFEGYEALKEFDWETYRRRHPNIMRLDLILEAEGDSPNNYKLSKQADVLMLFYLFSAEKLTEVFAHMGYDFDPTSIPRTIDYYLRRTSHGSTLSSIVHAWVLARCCRQRSWSLFTEALHSDIADVQGGTTREGIHLGAMAGTVDLLQRCFPGLEPRGDELRSCLVERQDVVARAVTLYLGNPPHLVRKRIAPHPRQATTLKIEYKLLPALAKPAIARVASSRIELPN
jgi:HAD superfamily hydrolase (TIGR01509 family)